MAPAKEIIDREKAEEILQIVSFFCYQSIGQVLASSWFPAMYSLIQMFKCTDRSIDHLLLLSNILTG